MNTPRTPRGVPTRRVTRPAARGGMVSKQPVDDQVYRTMPITEKQLGQIKKMYGIK